MTKKNILVVDDEPVVLRVMRVALEKAGYAVETCVNGHEALAGIEQRQPDALITDIEMPTMGGKALCERLEIELPDRGFPVFVSTSLTNLEHRQWSSKISNLHFIEKPISIRQLLARLNDYFLKSTSSAEDPMG